MLCKKLSTQKHHGSKKIWIKKPDFKTFRSKKIYGGNTFGPDFFFKIAFIEKKVLVLRITRPANNSCLSGIPIGFLKIFCET